MIDPTTRVRRGKYPVAAVLQLLRNRRVNRPTETVFDGVAVKLSVGPSTRYACFLQSATEGNIRCAICGLEASFFALERQTHDKVAVERRIKSGQKPLYHFNLYGTVMVEGKDKEVLFTKDHIIPRSMGGEDRCENYQTACAPCNNAKAGSYKIYGTQIVVERYH